MDSSEYSSSSSSRASSGVRMVLVVVERRYASRRRMCCDGSMVVVHTIPTLFCMCSVVSCLSLSLDRRPFCELYGAPSMTRSRGRRIRAEQSRAGDSRGQQFKGRRLMTGLESERAASLTLSLFPSSESSVVVVVVEQHRLNTFIVRRSASSRQNK